MRDVRISSKGIRGILFDSAEEVHEFLNLVDAEDFSGVVGFSYQDPDEELIEFFLN